MAIDRDEVINELLRLNKTEEIFRGLDNKRKDGAEDIKADCPFCGGDDFSFSLIEPLYHCWNCGESGDWLNYLMEAEGLEFREALFRLAELAGYDPEDYEGMSSSKIENIQERKQKADIWQEAHDLFRDYLLRPDGEEVRDYLKDRGYNNEIIEEMDIIGAYPDRQKFIEDMKERGFTEEDLREKAGLLIGSNEGWGMGKTHKLTILMRDQGGRPAGIKVRTLEDHEPKYLNSKNAEKNRSLTGLSKARRKGEVTIVEGALDSALLNAKDIPAVEIGGKNLSDVQLDGLKRAGINTVNIALDPDAKKQAEKALQKMLSSSGINVYTVSLPEDKDPDEIVREQGIEAFEERLQQAQDGVKWLAMRILSRHDLETDKGLDKALMEAEDVMSKIGDQVQAKRFMKQLKEGLDLSEEEIKARVQEKKESRSQEKAKDALAGALDKAKTALQKDNIIRAQNILETGIRESDTKRGLEAPEPYLLDDYLTDMMETEEGLKTGYKSLDDKIKIPKGALSFVAGRTGHGKTTFMLNLMLNMLEEYEDQNFYFFSYEEAKKNLITKLIMAESEEDLGQPQSHAYLNYFKFKRTAGDTNRTVEQAIDKIGSYMDEGRLMLVAEPLNAKDLSSKIRYMSQKDDNIGAVFVDYIQKISSGAEESQRYREVAEVCEKLRVSAQMEDIPIIAGAQCNRDAVGKDRIKVSHLRESGDIAQDANLIFGLVNEARKGENNNRQGHEEDPAVLKVNVAKNRDGASGFQEELDFYMTVRKIKSIQSGY